MTTPTAQRRAVLLGTIGASVLVVGLGALTVFGGPVAAQGEPTTTTSTTAASTTTTTAAPTTTTTAAPTTTTTTRPATTTTTRPRTTTTTRPRTTTSTVAPSTTSSSTTSSSTSTTVAAAAVAPPGFTTPDGDSGGGGGGWSTDTKIAGVVGGLLAVAAGLGALSFVYWRGTRPGVAGPAVDPTGTVGEAAAVAASEAAAAPSILEPVGVSTGRPVTGATAETAGVAGGNPAAGTAPDADPLALLLAGLDPVDPDPADAEPGHPDGGAHPAERPTIGPVPPGPSSSVRPVLPEATPAPEAGVPLPSTGPPIQPSGVRIVGPVPPAEPVETAEPAMRWPSVEFAEVATPFVTRDDLERGGGSGEPTAG